MFKSQAMGFATTGRHDEDVPQVTGSLIVVTFLFIDLPRSNWKNAFETHLNGIVSVFLAASIQPMKRLEVFSGVDTRNKDKNEIAITIAALRTFENDIRTKYNFPLFTLTVKEETRVNAGRRP